MKCSFCYREEDCSFLRLSNKILICDVCLGSYIPRIASIASKLIEEAKYHKWPKGIWEKAAIIAGLEIDIPLNADSPLGKITKETDNNAWNRFLATGEMVKCDYCFKNGNMVMCLIKTNLAFICEGCIIRYCKILSNGKQSTNENVLKIGAAFDS
jgi:hypothetical protein